MSNPADMNDGDVVRIQILIDLCVQNQWYGIAESLRRARDELKKQLDRAWAERLLDELLEDP